MRARGPAVLLVVLAAAAAACGDDGGTNNPPIDAPPIEEPDAPPIEEPDAPPVEPAPPLRNAVTSADRQLATQALKLMGANVPGAATASCNECHALTRQQLRHWRTLSDTAMSECLTDLTVASKDSALTMLSCLRAMPDKVTSDYQATKLGIYAAAAHLPWFEYTFERAYGDTATSEHARFQQNAAMPRAPITPLTQSQFDIVAEWFARGVPLLDESLPDDPAPELCTPGASPAVRTHVAAMATLGWGALNRQAGMAMHGCGAATDPLQCLASVPLASTIPRGTGWDLPARGQWRLLRQVTYSTSFWTRSSPDGRFIGHGVQSGAGSMIIDLMRGVEIPVNASYDPAWFPDNSGFVFQGQGNNVCGQSVLTSNPSSVSMSEAACTDLQTVGLYEHVGQALDGGDYFAIDGGFVSDNGGHGPTHGDPSANFGSHAQLRFTPMIWSGLTYVARPAVDIDTPFEGDSVLSPSARLVISRVEGDNGRQVGFVLRQVNATPAGNSYAIELPELARYCVSGGKPAFSYDERWAVYHHYITDADAVSMGFSGPNDPGFAQYRALGAANIYLLDLASGDTTRISNVQPGQYALFPHFRSDGWIYADVRDYSVGLEYMVASDAALRL